MKKANRRVSPALIVAVVALIAGLAGTAVAASGLTSKQKKQVRKIADKEIKKKASGLSVNHAKTADSATSAGSANTANTANNANTVNGTSVTKIFAKLANPTTGADLGTIQGYLHITADCAGGAANITLDPVNVSDVAITSESNGSNAPAADENYGSEPNSIDLDGGNGYGAGTFDAARDSNGSVISGMLGWDYPSTFASENVCGVFGHVFSS